jgi:transposase
VQGVYLPGRINKKAAGYHMKTRQLVLTQEEKLTLEDCIATADQELTRTRLRAVLLYGSNTSVKDIQAEVRCSRSSLMNWCGLYRSGGIQGLVDGRRGGNNAKLSQDQVYDLVRRLKRYTPWMILGDSSSTPSGEHWTAKDLFRAIKVWYGVAYQSRSSYYNLLERLGIKPEELQSFPDWPWMD